MIVYQLDEQNRRCREIALPVEKGMWTSNHWLKTITLYFEDFEIFEPYRFFPGLHYSSLPEISNTDSKIDAAKVIFRFSESNEIKTFGQVSLPYSDGHITHKLKMKVSALELAKTLSNYFATSPDQQGHSATALQSLYWRFLEWGFNHFSMDLTSLEAEDQECYIGPLYDAFKLLTAQNKPFVPSEPFHAGRAAIHWSEQDADHYLFMDKAGQIYHYCDSLNILFDKVS